jgi:MFS family permease
MGIFSSLKREQREAIGLLQIGTFLEYFDLMLYVHMAVILNELFFPKTDVNNVQLLSAFAFCSSFVFRPVGAYIFGKIGDTIGRKATVIITTTIMSVSCLIMATLPTYDQIGISAAWIVTICRIVQGLSSMGEVIGAQIYLTEMIKPPLQYSAVGIVSVSSAFGPMAALGVATLTTMYMLNWRYAFAFGALIAIVGAVARVRLKESSEFADMQARMKKAVEDSHENGLGNAAELLLKTRRNFMGKVPWVNSFAYFCTGIGWPACFYFSYMHCGNLLKLKFGFSGEEVIAHNFKISILYTIVCLLIVFLVKTINPLKIAKFRSATFLCGLLPMVFFATNPESVLQITLIQIFCLSFSLTTFPADPIAFSHFPIFRRFTCVSMAYAWSRAAMYLVTSFGLVYLNEWFGEGGLLIIFLPCAIASLWGIHHFEKLERGEGLSHGTRIQNNVGV